MIEALPHPQESKRLEAVHTMKLLDTPLEERFERITRMVCTLLNVPVALFNILDDERQFYKSVQGWQNTNASLDGAFCRHTILGEDMMLVPDATQDKRFHDNPFVVSNPNVRFYAGCPIHTADGMPVGTLCAIDTKPRQLTEDQLGILRDLAGMIETEIRVINLSEAQKQLIQDLDNANRLALIDPLTRLWNRAGIREILTREWHDAQRQQLPITVIMADIDHFKNVNDTFGHAAGDIVLREVAKNLLESLRGEDAVGRVGGEEFLLFLKNLSDRDRIVQIITRLQESLSLNSRIISTLKHPVTMSFGIATTVPQKLPEGAESLINEADAALYRAKRAGRNRFEFAA